MNSTNGTPSNLMKHTRKRQLNDNPAKNTRRLERIISLISFLSNYRTIKEMAYYLKLNEKSVQILKSFGAVGF